MAQYLIFEKTPVSIHYADKNIGVNVFHKHFSYIYIDDYKFILNNLYNRQAYNIHIILDYPKLNKDMKTYCNRLDKAKLSKFCQYYKNIKNITKDCSILDTRLAKIIRMIDKDGKFIYPNKIERCEQNEIRPANITTTGVSNERTIANIIKDKKVAIVGPSQYLIGLKLGRLIDGYDIIIRTNNSYQIPTEYHVDYGSTCDILCVNSGFTQNKFKENINTIKNVTPNVIFKHRAHYNIYRNQFISDVIDLDKHSPYLLLGTLLLEKMKTYSPSELFICGMDNYQINNSESMNQSYYTGYLDKKGSIINKDNIYFRGNHNLLFNKKRVREIVLNNNLITYDKMFNDIYLDNQGKNTII